MKINDTLDGTTLSLATPRTNSFQSFGEALNDIHATLSKNKEITKRDKKEADAEFDNKSFIDFANSGQDINTYLTKENPLAFKNASTIINAVNFDNNKRKSKEDIRSKKLMNDNATDKYEDDKLLSIYYTDPKEFPKQGKSFALGSTIRTIYDDTLKRDKLELEKDNSKFNQTFKVVELKTKNKQFYDNLDLNWEELKETTRHNRTKEGIDVVNADTSIGQLRVSQQNANSNTLNSAIKGAEFTYKLTHPYNTKTKKPQTMKQVLEDREYTSKYLSQDNPLFNSLDERGKNYAISYYLDNGNAPTILDDGGIFGTGFSSKAYIPELQKLIALEK